MSLPCSSFFFFNDTATTEIYTLSLHDALPICARTRREIHVQAEGKDRGKQCARELHADVSPSACPSHAPRHRIRSEEHTSELQSLAYLVCRLLLEKKKQNLQPVPVGIRSRARS